MATQENGSSTAPELYAIQLTKEQLIALPDVDRELMIRMGLVMNDLLLLQRLFLAVGERSESPAAVDAGAAHMLNLLLLLAGRVFEATEVYRKFFVMRPSHREKRSRLCESGQQACDAINRVTGASGLLASLRNSFAFHYHDADDLTQHLVASDSDSALTLYLGNPDGNTLHYYALQPIWQSLINITGAPDGGKAIDIVWADVFGATKALMTFTNAVTKVALADIFGDAVPRERCQLHAHEYQPLDSVWFPPLMALPTRKRT